MKRKSLNRRKGVSDRLIDTRGALSVEVIWRPENDSIREGLRSVVVSFTYRIINWFCLRALVHRYFPPRSPAAGSFRSGREPPRAVNTTPLGNSHMHRKTSGSQTSLETIRGAQEGGESAGEERRCERAICRNGRRAELRNYRDARAILMFEAS